MKLSHNIPARRLGSDPITPAYQAEVDKSTNRAMVAYERAQRRLAAANDRLTRARAKRDAAVSIRVQRAADRELRVATELVELRRDELLEVEALMKAVPASAEHRGTRGFRPVPMPGGTF